MNRHTKTIKKFYIFIYFIAVFPLYVLGGIEFSGTTSINFVKIPPFARAAAMGDAFTAVSDGSYGLYYNPAGMSFAPGFEIQAAHVSWFRDINYEYASFVMPAPFGEEGKLGFALSWFQIDAINGTTGLSEGELLDLGSVDYNAHLSGSFSPFDFSVLAGYSLNIWQSLYGGIVIKYAGQQIDTYSGSEVSADLGLIYRQNVEKHDLRAGVELKGLGTELKMKDIAFAPPKIFKLGVSDMFELFSGKFLVSGQITMQDDYDSIYGLGMEYRFQNFAALRAGYKFGAFNQLTAGAGVKYNNFEFDYAYSGFEELGGTHRFSMLYSWGAPPVGLGVTPGLFSPNGDKFLDDALFSVSLKTRENLKKLAVVIEDENGIVTAELPVRLTDNMIRWTGMEAGMTLPDGVYSAVLKAEYESGISESEKVKVEIDNTAPETAVNAEPMFLRPGKSDALLIPAVFTLSAHDRNKTAKWQLLVWDINKKVFCNTGGNGQPPPTFVWDGRSPEGEYVETGEIYYYSLITYDTVGNRAQTKPKAQVVLLREVKLVFSSDALFDSGEADVKITAYSIMKEMKKIIDKNPEVEVMVTGYTDNSQPKAGKYRSNVELSKARAEAVKYFMVNLLGMKASRIMTQGLGESSPIVSNGTQEGRSKNRRVEIMIKSTVYK